ncbi:MAG: ABC transporter ATP-binding protein/permease [Clostridia bacterium]|nr:ABC transporter ATP-binding protein/permease [Clostridia bacterium]
MLQIKNISKRYKTGELVQIALNKVSLNFRNNEFVSILGPSGSGKTTLLNIIGGLDRYDSGDLIINNVSTKKYKDRDWDSYRNHTVGFVFQSYNLIPHQTILANVELALTIGGISKKERRIKALNALEKVGLKEQAHKKPNQMSGGQMQRVAIARALVNDPDILLADEPTGALDTTTSVQVMELLKEVAKDRLVVMVTHNPELAETYSTRIVRLKDGEVISDSNPFNLDEAKTEKPKHKNLGKASMSWSTAFSLSLNNLLTKKGRTILTSFAGSIGIIGIAMILSLSTGFQNYIDKIQEDALTSYPLTITAETADAMSMLLSMTGLNNDQNQEEGMVVEKQNVADMFATVGKNDLKTFKHYLEDNEKIVDDMVSLTKFTYAVSPMIYTKNNENKLVLLNPSDFFSSLMGSTSSFMTSGISIFSELVDNKEMLESQFRIVEGKWPEKYNEVILILPNENSISDMLLYGLGLRDLSELEDMIAQIMEGKKVENKNEPLEFTYEELMNLELKLVDATKTYKYNSKFDVYEDMSADETFMNNVYNEASALKIVGIVCPKSESSGLMSGIGYTKALTEHVINVASESEIVKKQLSNKSVNVFSGKSFDDKNKTAGLNFEDMISIDTDMLSSAFGSKISEKDISKLTGGYITEISKAITTDTSKAKNTFLSTLETLTTNLLNDYIDKNQNHGVAVIKLSQVDEVVDNFMKEDNNKVLLLSMEKDYLIKQDVWISTYSGLIKSFLQQYINMMSSNSPGNQAEDPSAMLAKSAVETMVTALVKQETIVTLANTMGAKMTEAIMQKTILSKVGELTAELMQTVAKSFNVDENKIAAAFKFDMSEEELKRIFTAMTSTTVENADTNLLMLGYQNIDEPTSISFYFKDFESKESFIEFLDNYNKETEKKDSEKVIKYTDITGMLMSSVKTIVDSVSYVLIAFVSISLVVSSIMIGIITYISVLERTKEIGVLRAIGASKKNISSIFNAETFIVGLFSGILGIATTLLLLIPVNAIIHGINTDITAVLPVVGATILVVLSVLLTLVGGLIPSKQAAKKDPVLALRSE